MCIEQAQDRLRLERERREDPLDEPMRAALGLRKIPLDDTEKLENYMRLKEPWRYENES